MTYRMTSGAIGKNIIKMALPILLGQLLQQLYSIVDSIIVGRYLGVNALASVGATWSLTYIVCDFCIGSCMGISVPLSQAYGAGNNKLLRSYFINGVYCATILTVVMTVFTSVFSMKFLQWLGTSPGIIKGAHTYLIINFIGLPFTILFNFCFGVLLAFGDSRKSSVFMAFSTVLNLVFDLVLILWWKLGIAGAAVSTIVSQGIAGSMSLVYILRKYKILLPEKQELGWNGNCVRNIIRMCLPMGLQYTVTAVGALILQRSVNDISEAAVAAYSAGSKIKGMFLCPLHALGTSLSTFAGQNYGVGNMERIRKGYIQTTLLGILYSFCVILFAMIARHWLALLFVSSKETVVLRYVEEFIMYISIFQIELAILYAARYCVQGMGDGQYSIYSGFAEMLGRAVAAMCLIPVFKFTAVCWSEGITFFAGIIVIVPICIYLIKKYAINQAKK